MEVSSTIASDSGDFLDNKPSEMPFLTTIGLILTYKCQVACPHCILKAGPHRSEEVPLEDALDWIGQISDYSKGHEMALSLTGGEPFYDLDRLSEVSSFAKDKGLIVSAVTNAFWANSNENAIAILRDLPSIDALAVSADMYHQSCIPLDRVINAVSAARELNILCYINICTESLEDDGYKAIKNRLEKVISPKFVVTIITMPVGRAASNVDISRFKTTLEPPISSCSSSSSPVIFPNGNVIACIGPLFDLKTDHPLALGSLKERPLSSILDDAELNPILHAIRIWGPRKLISMAKEAGLSKYLPERYLENSICSACYEIMSRPEIIDFLDKLSQDFEFRRMIAYARAYYLHEYKMAEHYKLTIRE